MVNKDSIFTLGKQELADIIRTEVYSAFDTFKVNLELDHNSKAKKKYHSRKTTKERLSCSYVTLWKLDKTGELPAVRLGDKVLYDPDVVDAYLRRKQSGA